jgi:hypothetical protein
MGRHVSPARPSDEPRDEGHGLASDKTIISSFKKTINAVALSLATRPRERSRFWLGLVTGLLLGAQPQSLDLILSHWH